MWVIGFRMTRGQPGRGFGAVLNHVTRQGAISNFTRKCSGYDREFARWPVLPPNEIVAAGFCLSMVMSRSDLTTGI